MTKTPRQHKTAKQRAEEALAVAERRVARLNAERGKHLTALDGIVADLKQAIARREYLAADPALGEAEQQAAETGDG